MSWCFLCVDDEIEECVCKIAETLLKMTGLFIPLRKAADWMTEI